MLYGAEIVCFVNMNQKTVDQQQKELDDQLKAVLAQDPHLARENDRPKTVPSKQQDKDY